MSRKDMEIYGADGYLVAVDDRTVHLRMRGDPAEKRRRLPPAPGLVRDPFNYLAAVARGGAKVEPGNLWSSENALSVVKILEAARVSAREGRTVKLE